MISKPHRPGMHRPGIMRASAFLALPILLVQHMPVAAQENLDALMNEARAETAARTLRTPDGVALCFPPPALLEGSEAHVIGGHRLFSDRDRVLDRESSIFLDVFTEPTDAPVLLLLRGAHSIVWRLHLAEGARLAAIHLVSKDQSFVIGTPEGVPVTSRYKIPMDGGEDENCVFADKDPDGEPEINSGIRNFAYGGDGGRFSDSVIVRLLRAALWEYAKVPVVSFPGRANGRFEASRDAIASYEAVRQRGRDWLAAHPPPPIDTLGPGVETMSVPEHLTNVAAMEWLVGRGYARRSTRDEVEYLCGRRLAMVLLEGEDLNWDWEIQNCPARQRSSKMFTILGPIRIVKANCRGYGSPALLAPGDVEVDWDHSCSWMRLEHPDGNTPE